MLLIGITHPEFFAGEAVILNELFAEGLAICHLRKPIGGEAEHRQLLDAIHPQYYNRIALHQQHQLAGDYGITRLHVKSAAPPGEHIYSTSIHELKPLPSTYAYAFFSPVFDSISKPGYKSVVEEGFVLKSQTVPLIALGGVDAATILKVKEMNFDGAAVLGALWQSPDQAVRRFKKLQSVCAHM